MSSENLIAQHEQAGRTVEIKGRQIFYRVEGAAGGPPVVFTHGIPRSSFLYRRMLPLFAGTFHTYAWDLPGFGLSDKPLDETYTFPVFGEYLGKFLDAFNIAQAHLVCHDIGGPVAIGYAVRHPERVRTLTILNTTVFPEHFRAPTPVLRVLQATLSAAKDSAPPEGAALAAQGADDIMTDDTKDYMRTNTLASPDAVSDDELDAIQELGRRNNGQVTLMKTIQGYIASGPYVRETREMLKDFRRPTLVCFGTEDPFCPPPNAEAFHKELPDSELVLLDNAKHFIQEDSPKRVSKAILDFLERRGGLARFS